MNVLDQTYINTYYTGLLLVDGLVAAQFMFFWQCIRVLVFGKIPSVSFVLKREQGSERLFQNTHY
jgi:hypothetical protein